MFKFFFPLFLVKPIVNCNSFHIKNTYGYDYWSHLKHWFNSNRPFCQTPAPLCNRCLLSFPFSHRLVCNDCSRRFDKNKHIPTKKYKTTWPQCPVSLMCTYSNVTVCPNIDHNSPQRFTLKHQCRISDCNLICVKWSVFSCSTFENVKNIYTQRSTRGASIRKLILGYYFLAGTRNFLKSLLVILRLLPHKSDPTPNRLLRACSHVLVCSQIANVVKSSTYKILLFFYCLPMNWQYLTLEWPSNCDCSFSSVSHWCKCEHDTCRMSDKDEMWSSAAVYIMETDLVTDRKIPGENKGRQHWASLQVSMWDWISE